MKKSLKYILAIIFVVTIAVVFIEVRRRGDQSNTQSTNKIAQQSTAFPREIIDSAGETLKIEKLPQRIVSQTNATDEILMEICAPERIVALSSIAEDANYSNIVEKAKLISGRTTQGAEQILQMQPDLIFVASYSRAETVDLLKASRAPVIRLANFNSLEDIKNNILSVGYATGCEAEAAKLTLKMDAELSRIRARAGQNAPRVMAFGGGFTAGKNTTFDAMTSAAGAVNVSTEKGIDGHAKISAEKLIEWQPDFIIAGANRGELDLKLQQMLADPIIKNTNAGKNGKIIIVENNYYLSVSHNIVRGVEKIADGLYGTNSTGNN